MYLTIITSVIFTLLSLANYPEVYAIHWGVNGQADGFSSGISGIILFPIIMIVMQILFLVIPKIDPKRKNIALFSDSFESFILAFQLFFLYLHIATFVWNSIYEFNFNKVILIGFAGLFFVVGSLLKNAHINYTIGIRTPWTLADEEIWNKTHKLGAKIVKVVSILSLMGLFLPNFAFLIFLGLIVGSFLFLGYYSYYLFKKKFK